MVVDVVVDEATLYVHIKQIEYAFVRVEMEWTW